MENIHHIQPTSPKGTIHHQTEGKDPWSDKSKTPSALHSSVKNLKILCGDKWDVF